MPRKSTASTSVAPTSPTTAQAGDTSMLSNATEPKSPTTKSSKKKDDDSVGIDDLLLPRSLTSRISRGILPPNTSLQKDAALALTKSATVFISYLASTANELTSRKTISPQDVMKAIHECELDRVMGIGEVGKDGRVGGRLERELEVFESVVRGKRKGYREKVKARESGVSGVDGEEAEEEREKKRVRRTSDDQDEEDLLDKQLNGSVDERRPDTGIAERMFGATGVDDATREQDYGVATGKFDGPRMEDNDETEDDPEVEEDEEDVVEDEDEEQDPNDEDQDRIDIDEGGGERSRLMLAPNGRAEVGSEDDSD